MEIVRQNEFKVELRETTGRWVCFDVTPDLVETRNVNYKTIDPIHAPGQIYVYGNTSSRTFSLSGVKLVSRSSKEATRNLARLWLIRGWTTPAFGRSDTGSNFNNDNREPTGNWTPFSGPEYEDRNVSTSNTQGNRRDHILGTPPQVLYLTAYSRFGGDKWKGHNGHLRRIPVVIQNLTIPYPSDCDYIPTHRTGTPMPTIMTIDITLSETHSPTEYENFSLEDFKNGRLPNF